MKLLSTIAIFGFISLILSIFTFFYPLKELYLIDLIFWIIFLLGFIFLSKKYKNKFLFGSVIFLIAVYIIDIFMETLGSSDYLFSVIYIVFAIALFIFALALRKLNVKFSKLTSIFLIITSVVFLLHYLIDLLVVQPGITPVSTLMLAFLVITWILMFISSVISDFLQIMILLKESNKTNTKIQKQESKPKKKRVPKSKRKRKR